MAFNLEFIEGFDNYPVNTGFMEAIPGAGFTYIGGVSARRPSTVNVRTGSAALQMGPNIKVGRGFNPTGQPRVLIGCAAAWYSIATAFSTLHGAGIRSVVTGNQIVATGDVSGYWSVYRIIGGVSANIVQTPKAYNPSIYQYMIMDYNNATGRVRVWVDRTLICDDIGTPIGDQLSGQYANQMVFGPNSNNGSAAAYFDDAFGGVDPTDGDVNLIAGLGSFEARPFRPVSNGLTQQWSVTGAPSAFDAINDTPPTAGKYIEAANVNDFSDFNFENASVNASLILGLCHQYQGSEDIAGANDIQASVISSGTAGPGANQAQSTVGTWFSDIYQIDPNTGVTWVDANLNSLQTGFTRTL